MKEQNAPIILPRTNCVPPGSQAVTRFLDQRSIRRSRLNEIMTTRTKIAWCCFLLMVTGLGIVFAWAACAIVPIAARRRRGILGRRLGREAAGGDEAERGRRRNLSVDLAACGPAVRAADAVLGRCFCWRTLPRPLSSLTQYPIGVVAISGGAGSGPTPIVIFGLAIAATAWFVPRLLRLVPPMGKS